MTKKTVLFLCSGNYYRSRFAEFIFNWFAHQAASPWQAESRGLADDLGRNVGAISAHALQALRERRIPVVTPVRFPKRVERQDLERAAHIVAVKELEHRPLMEQFFPEWVHRIEYWHIHDLDAAEPAHALAELEVAVRDLHDRLMQLG